MNSTLIRRIEKRGDVIGIVVLLNLMLVFSYFNMVAIPGVLFNQLQHDLALSSAAVALVGGLYMYIYGGMQAFAGALVDRFGPIRVVIVGGTLLSIGSILFPLSHSITTLYASRIVVALGASVVFLSIVKELDMQFSDKNFIVLLGIALTVGNLGGLMGTRPLDAAATAYGWRAAMLAIGIACSMLVVCIALVSRKIDRPEQERAPGNVLGPLKRIVANHLSYPVIVMYTIAFGIYFVFQAVIGKKMLQDCLHMGSAGAAVRVGVLSLIVVIGALAAGIICRINGNRRKPMFMILTISGILGALCGILVLKHGSVWVIPCYVLIGVSASGTSIFGSSMKELNEPEFAGSSVGVLNGVTCVGAGGLAALAGISLDHFATHAVRTASEVRYPSEAYMMIMIGCLVLAIVAFFCSLMVRETAGRNIWETKSPQTRETASR
jgi:MFS family permease